MDKDTKIIFSQAAERKNIISGESIATVFGKVMKFFADLKTVAFSGKYTDLTDTPTSLKNPKALTFTGGVTGSYDGSAEKSVAIPSVTNNFLATVPGTAFDAVRGKELKDENTQIKADLATINSNLGGFSVKSAMGSEIRDANAAEMGIYHIGERMPNSAFNFWSTIIATSFRNGWTQQICFPWSSNEKRIAYRLKNADGWQSWHYINFDN